MSLHRCAPLFVSAAILLSELAAQTSTQKIRAYRVTRETDWIEEYLRFVALPNVSSDRAGIRRNAEFIMAMMKARGIGDVRLLEPKSAAGNPVVYGEVKVPDAKRTVVFYAHYDGQPVNPAQWAAGWEPYAPKFVTGSAERGGRIVEGWKRGWGARWDRKSTRLNSSHSDRSRMPSSA